MAALEFDMSFEPAYGEAVAIAPDVLRLTANNPSPFTFHGTNSYVVGRDTLQQVAEPLDAKAEAVGGLARELIGLRFVLAREAVVDEG